MKRTLVMRPQAELDLLRHCCYLAEHNAPNAGRLRDAVRATTAKIKRSPRTAATLNLPSFPDVELRFRKPEGFDNYLIVFQVADDAVFVLRILHGSQDIEAALRQ